MMTDNLADMLTRIRNALMMQHKEVRIPYSRLKESILKIFTQEGYIRGVEVSGEKVKKTLTVSLKYGPDGKSVISTLQRVSRPSRRVFSGHEDLESFRKGLGVRVLTTSKGILSDFEARRQKIGGEILMEIW